MNIFLLSYERNPYKHFKEQAAYHCDKHVIKMIAESTQLIITGMTVKREAGAFSDSLSDHYKLPSMQPAALPCKPLGSGHAKHPCCLWASASIKHVHYLVRLAIALCNEKKKRWPIKADHEYEVWLHAINQDLFALGFCDYDPLPLDFAVAVKDAELRSTALPHHEAVAIYRSYYVTDKASFATWRKVMTPIWYQMDLELAASQQPSTLTYAQGVQA